ncbi:MAG: hypothetical protein AB1489_42940, partial [Acidobacteriota bacterium]
MEETQRFADEYSNYHVQGSLIKSRLLYIHVNHGAAAIKSVINVLPAEVQQQLSAIFIGEWYPLSLLVLLDHTITKVLVAGDERAYQELGAFSADLNLTGAYEPLIRKNVHEFLQLTAVLHRAYQDFGEAQYLRLGETAALLQFRYPQPPPEFYCKSGLGYLRRA